MLRMKWMTDNEGRLLAVWNHIEGQNLAPSWLAEMARQEDIAREARIMSRDCGKAVARRKTGAKARVWPHRPLAHARGSQELMSRDREGVVAEGYAAGGTCFSPARWLARLPKFIQRLGQRGDSGKPMRPFTNHPDRSGGTHVERREPRGAGWPKRSLCLIGVVVLVALAASFGWAFARGSASGTVKDPSGGVIPGATVSVVNTATGFAQLFGDRWVCENSLENRAVSILRSSQFLK